VADEEPAGRARRFERVSAIFIFKIVKQELFLQQNIFFEYTIEPIAMHRYFSDVARHLVPILFPDEIQ
jgi:hypothetical protein